MSIRMPRGEEGADVFGPVLLHSIGPADVLEPVAVIEVVAVLPILILLAFDLDHGVGKRIELGADLADLGRHQLVHEGLAVVVAGPGEIMGRIAAARNGDRIQASREHRRAQMVGHAERSDLALRDQLGCLDPLLRCDVARGACLIVGAELTRPPVLVDRVVLRGCRTRSEQQRPCQGKGGNSSHQIHRHLPS
ncbi:MAG: hypothetical protein OET79_15775, partial [Nitrospirota bacterium]|nr:hypothetical protein [Nitrospirota bacterium]